NEVTACVWVGYPDTTTPMTTLYEGGPVMGGTFPALIWASVISAWEEIKATRTAEKAAKEAAKGNRGAAEELESEAAEGGEYLPVEPSTEEAPEEEGGTEAAPEEEPEAPEAPPEGPEAATEPTPEPAPESGGGGGVTAG
ncbi:MAG: hypothetical protein QOF23_1265, partial [Solirubrobacterales bacterium]|nr:hypothetical protein [Solirubrobacterales bacterium]